MTVDEPELSAPSVTAPPPLSRPAQVVGQFRLDLRSQSWWWSIGLWKLLGYSSSSDPPTTALLLEHLPGTSRSALQGALGATASSGLAFTWSGRASRLDGAIREVVVYGECETDADGRTAAVTGFVLDLTLGQTSTATGAAWSIRGTSRSAQSIRDVRQEMLNRSPPEEWSETLDVAVNLCLEAEAPACVLWGTDLIQYYNDFYADAIAPNRPCLIGRPAADNWPEVWDTIGPDIRSVLTTGVALTKDSHSLSVIRDNRLTESFFDYAVTPLRERDGSIGGVFCVVLDSTARRIAARRDTIRRDLGELCSTAAAAPAAEQSLAAAMSVLASDPEDIPFAAVYSLDLGRQSARRCAVHGLNPQSWACPARWEFPEPSPWPFEAAVEAGTIILHDLASHDPPIVAGPWPEPIRRAAIVALSPRDPRSPTEVLIVGLSPRLAYDDAYQHLIGGVAQAIGGAVATRRALAFADAHVSNLQVALTTNRRIGAAVGVLMALRKVNEEAAFDVLRETSQRTRRKLREVAEDVLRTGELPQ